MVGQERNPQHLHVADSVGIQDVFHNQSNSQASTFVMASIVACCCKYQRACRCFQTEVAIEWTETALKPECRGPGRCARHILNLGRHHPGRTRLGSQIRYFRVIEFNGGALSHDAT
jgi:hypothetical protein